MSKNRYINTKFWDDEYISELEPIQKLLFLYIITNSLTNICGVYEITLKRICFDTGISQKDIMDILEKFDKDLKIKYSNGWIGIKNFIKHQKVSDNKNDKINIGIENGLANIPQEFKDWINTSSPIEAPSTPLKPLATPLNYSNSNSNSNSNNNNIEDKSSTLKKIISDPILLEEKRKECLDWFVTSYAERKKIEILPTTDTSSLEIELFNPIWKNFIAYFFTLGEGEKKMPCEKQKSFNIKLRFITWERNERTGFGKLKQDKY